MVGNTIKELFCRWESCEIENGVTVYVINDSSRGDLDTLVGKLCACGFGIYAENVIGENIFSTLTGQKRTVGVGYFPSLGMIRVVIEAQGQLPARAEDNIYKAVTTPFISQRRCPNLKDNAGMSYVIRLCDGRFILIDGGFDDHDAAEELVEFLESNTDGGKKPTIAAAFITHSHNDHIGVITRLLKSYRDRLNFNDFIFNWPDSSLCAYGDVCDHKEFDSELESLDGAKVIRAETGQRFHYADSTFEILYTPDDVYPERIDKFNDSSLVMRMTLNGHRVLWMADAGMMAVKTLLERYSPSVFKCEVLQVTHHGYGGGDPELDRAADPRILLWPAPDYWYRVVRKWKHNEYLINSPKIECTVVSGRGSVTLDFGEDIRQIPEQVEEYPDGVLYRRILSETTPCKSSLTAIITKKKHLVGVNVKVRPEGFLLCPDSDGKVLVEVLPPSIMKKSPSFILRIDGVMEDSQSKFGILINQPTPTAWDGEGLIEIGEGEGSFSAKFSADAKSGKAYLEMNGACTATTSYSPTEECGLHLGLVGGAVTLSYIEVSELTNL